MNLNRMRTLKFITLFHLLLFSAGYIGSWIHIQLGSTKEMLDIENEDGTWEVAWKEDGADVIPKDMKEAIAAIKAAMTDEQLENYRSYLIAKQEMSPSEKIHFEYTYGHMGMGMSIRSNWGLWHGSRLGRWLAWRGGGWYEADVGYSIIRRHFEAHLLGAKVTNLHGVRVLYLLVHMLIITVPLTLFFLVVKLAMSLYGKVSKKSLQATGVNTSPDLSTK